MKLDIIFCMVVFIEKCKIFVKNISVLRYYKWLFVIDNDLIEVWIIKYFLV